MFAALNKFGRLGAPSGRSLDAQIAALFADGVVFDPSDFSALYQDSAGTTPVTALEQPVGLMLDKNRGLVLGSELVANGDFSNGTTGWTAVNINTSGSSVVNGEFNVVAGAGGSGGFTQDVSVTAGKMYRVTVTGRKLSGSGAVRFQTYDGASFGTLLRQFFDVSTVGDAVTYTAYLFTTSTAIMRLYLFAATSTTGGFDNISIRELPGAHAYHTPGDTTTRTTVSRRINLLTKTEQFDDAAWTKTGMLAFGSGSVANATTAPDGTVTADLLVPNTTASAEHYVDVGTSIAITSGTSYTISWCGKAAGYKWLRLAFSPSIAPASERAAWFDVEAGVKGTTQPNVTSTIEALPNGFYRCTITRAATASLTPLQVGFAIITNADGGTGFTANGTSGMYWWGASLVPADLSGLPYQRVNTLTDYDTSSVFPTFLRCDGVNDSLQTNAIDFTGTDKMFVGAAVRKLSDAARAYLLEFSSIGSTPGIFSIQAPNTNGSANYEYFNSGTLTRAAIASGLSAPISNVLSGIGDISGDSVILRINGSQAANNTGDQGTGNYSSNKLYLFMRAGTSLPFNGWFFGSLIKGSTLSASQIALAERWLASKTKTVTLA